MRYTCTLLFALLFAVESTAQTDLHKRIIVIGNGYDAAKDGGEFLSTVRQNIPFDSNTIVLYLGNNVRSASDTTALRREVAIIENTDAKAFFVPGYMDWARGGKDGYREILWQQKFLKGLDNKNVKFYPGDGCPGPKKIELGNDAVMYIMDSQWWLHTEGKPDLESDCKYRTKYEVLAEVEDIPKEEFDKLVLMVMHHPMENTGVHSGTFGWKQHIFPLTDSRSLRHAYLPLPVIGSLYPILSNAISSPQDLQNREYQSMAVTGIRTNAGLTEAFDRHPNTVFLSGQEHNLQLLRKDNLHFINSGATGSASRVRANKDAVYVKQHAGFAVLEITSDKKLRTKFYLVSGNAVQEDYAAELLDYSSIPPLAKDTTTLPALTGDSVAAAANADMARLPLLKRILIGKNYREEWSTPVRMQVLHLDRVMGGLKPTGIGGGHESRSLQMRDGTRTPWVFRTSNKDLSAVIPEGFQETVASEFIQDLLSASNPYAAPVVAGLQKPLGIVHATPQMYFVSNDSALKAFRPLFANQVGLMEQRKPALNDWGQISTVEALNEMIGESNFSPDQKSFLKVRLIDFLVSDFDRHHGQYSWGMFDTGDRKTYYPIPKDRDQAFYHNRGLIMDIGRRDRYKFMTNFPYEIKRMRNMGIVGAYLDMLFTNGLTEADWKETITEFTTTLTDDVIDSAVRKFPPEIYALRGAETSAKLKSRRNSIGEKGLDYYSFITRKVNVLGGNKDDVFRVSSNDSGMLVQVWKRGESGSDELRYSRTFDPRYTREVRLYGFAGEDHFEVDPAAKSPIKLRILGGTGSDTFNIRGKVRNILYDLSNEDNQLLARNRTTKMFSDAPAVNEFVMREPLHNSFSLPLVSLGYNVEDGIIGGVSLTRRGHGFRKVPYGSLQRFTASFATATKSYMFRYTGEFIDVFRHYDLLPMVEHYSPVLRNFFGFGNETVRDTSRPFRYYRVRYDYLAGDFLVRKRFHRGNTMSISAGPSFYHYWYNEAPNRTRILERPSEVGLDSANVYSKKFYAGGRSVFAINTLNSDLLPTRGINWTTDFTALKSVSENAGSLTRLTSALDIYSVLSRPNRLMVALHFGGGHIFSDRLEYFQALTLGGNNYLRGYRVNRFSGSSMAYGSAELRAKLFDFHTYLLKGDFGVVGFNDIGRVWVKGDQSRKWHNGYGGGLYLTPYHSLMISALVGFSEEDMLFNISIGTRLNMVFQRL